MSKILITGGAGFIGSTLADSLIEQGNEVFILDNLSSGSRDYVNKRAKFWEIDLLDPSILDRFQKEKFDLVFHLAAQIDLRISVSQPEEDNRINIIGGLRILEAAYQTGVKKVIFASTGGAIYGDLDEIPSSENSHTYPLSPYGIHKLALEKYFNYYHKVYGLDYTTLRFANVYGPRQYKGGEAGVIAIFTEAAASRSECTLFGDGLQSRDFVYVDDIVRALELAAKISFPGEINLGTGRENNLLEIIQAIEKESGEKLKLIKAPAKAGEQRRSCLSSDRAKNVLNWEAKVDLREGIKRTLAWIKDKSEKKEA